MRISNTRAGRKEETRPNILRVDTKTERRYGLSRRQEEEEQGRKDGEATGGCQMGRGREREEGGKEARRQEAKAPGPFPAQMVKCMATEGWGGSRESHSTAMEKGRPLNLR